MPKVLVGKSHLFVCNGVAIAAFNLKVKENVSILEIPWISETVSGQSGQQTSANENDVYDEAELSRDSTSSCILQMSICKCGHHLAACNEQKQLVVWDVSKNFQVVCIRSVARKALCVCFMSDCKQLLVADKTGDVYQMHIDTTRPASNSDILLLGHLSMVLDMALSADNQLLMTCDRDEKIRISCFPNCYNIHAYCCGHKEFVVKLALLPNNTLVSGSGDGTVRFWNYRTGKEVYRLSRGESEIQAVKTVTCSSGSQPYLAVLFCGCKVVYVYRVQLEVPAVPCALLSEVELECEPWDICWEGEGDEATLWVFNATLHNHISKYKVQTEDGKLVECKDPLLDSINTQQRKFFQATVDSASLFPILYKRAYDQSVAGEAEEEAGTKRPIDSQSTSIDKKLKKK